MPGKHNLSLPLPKTRKVPPLAAITFILAVLLVYNFSNWRMLRLLEESKEEDLGRRLRSISRVISDSLKSPAPPQVLVNISQQGADGQESLLDAFPDTPEYEDLAQRLASMKASSGLAQVILLTPSGNVVADSNYRFLSGESLPFTIDTHYLQAALDGVTASTPLYEWEGEHFERDYHALTDDTGTTLGVVMSSISADYLRGMQQVRSQVFRLWLLSSVLLIPLGLWLYRTFRYVASLERRALQQVRVEAMGALAGGMAHELRNPLAIIRALAEEVEADQPEKNRSVENARDIIAETQRLSDLVTHFLSLSHAPDGSNAQPVSLQQEVQRVVQLMVRGNPPGVSIETDLPAGNLTISADERAVRQLLLNLLVNATEALSGQPGKISVTLKERRQQAELRIADTGAGIAPRDLARVFEPFFTTRPNGTGLGLALCKSIVDNLDGELKLESTVGKGTTAIITLPLIGER